jgi:hypothetical protein
LAVLLLAESCGVAWAQPEESLPALFDTEVGIKTVVFPECETTLRLVSAPGEGSYLGFFDEDESLLRTERFPELMAYNTSLDGYVATWGRRAEAEDDSLFMLSLFGPRGELLWEIRCCLNSLVPPLQVTRGGWRTIVTTVPDVLWDSYLELVLINEDGTPLQSRTLAPGTVVRLDPTQEYLLAISEESLSLLRVENLEMVWHAPVETVSPDTSSVVVVEQRNLVVLLHPEEGTGSAWQVITFDLESGERRSALDLPPEPANTEPGVQLVYREQEDELVVMGLEGEVCLNLE